MQLIPPPGIYYFLGVIIARNFLKWSVFNPKLFRIMKNAGSFFDVEF